MALGGVVPLMLEHPPSGAGRTVAVSLVVTGLVSAFVATPIVAHEARAHRDAAVSLYNEGVSPACPRASSDVTDR